MFLALLASGTSVASDHCFLQTLRRYLPGFSSSSESRVEKAAHPFTAQDYDQTVTRNLDNVSGVFDSYHGYQEFDKLRQSLKPGDLTMDVGSGTGLVSMDLINGHGVDAVTISVHDFTQRITDSIKYLKLENVTRKSGFVESVGPYQFADLRSMADSVGVDFPATMDSKAAAIQAKKVLEKYLAQRRVLLRQGKLKALNGYAEALLPSLKRKAKLITDFYGAVFYSEKRAQLLEEYYNHLAPGGKAFIEIGLKEDYTGFRAQIPGKDGGARAWDSVTPKGGGKPIEFYEYLVKKYPDIFSLKVSGGFAHHYYLVMTKVDNIETLNLGLKMDLSQMTRFQGNGAYNFPTGVLYHEN